MNSRKIPLFKVYSAPEASQHIQEVLRDGYTGQGPKVALLERQLQRWMGSHRIVTLNSATSALTLALHLLKKLQLLTYPQEDLNFAVGQQWDGLKEGDEVLSTPLTCAASNFSIIHNNLKIKWYDVDPYNLGPDFTDLERKLSPKTRVIMVVSWGGLPVNVFALERIKQKCFDLYGFRPIIIQDEAHSFGAQISDRFIPEFGNICSYSFQSIKHFSTSDGGCLVLPSPELKEQATLARWYGMNRTKTQELRCMENVAEAGFKYNLNDYCAALGLANLPHMEEILNLHRDNGKFYEDNVNLKYPTNKYQSEYWDNPSYWIFTVLVERRDDFERYMAEHGVNVNRVHERNDNYTCLKEFKASLPKLDYIAPKICAIPCGWWVSKEDREFIVSLIRAGW